ncbi:hypothetical protein SCG7086_AO_00060 [Chlamydiales bacterium SCGC AG-110-P3]|nr:hypothetical protein SCG7086_AO_00060 [Chlamydiales bacterium SCGC AG-110-P3]
MDSRLDLSSRSQQMEPPPIEELMDTAGSFNLIAKYIKSCTHHRTAEDLGDRQIVWKSRKGASKWNRLLKALSTNVTKELILPENSWLVSSARSIQQCVQDVMEHMLFTIVADGKEDAELALKDDDELMQLLVTNLIKKVRTTFGEDGTPEEHFKVLSEEILLSAFPGRWNDPHLPEALRSLGFKLAVGNPETLWNSSIEVLATYGSQLYGSLHQVSRISSEEVEEAHPGITKLVNSILMQSREKVTSESIYQDLKIPYLDEYSSDFVAACLPRLLSSVQGDSNEHHVLADFHTWTDAQIQHSIYAILGTLLKARLDQKPEDRRIEVFELLFSRMAEYQPKWKARRAEIDIMDSAAVKSALGSIYRSLKESPKTAATSCIYYRNRIEKFVANTKASEADGKALLQKLASFDFSESVFEAHEQVNTVATKTSHFLGVNREEFELFFPEFFTFETALTHIHSVAGEYFLAFERQSTAIEGQAAEATAYLKEAERGVELLATIDELVADYRTKTEKLAKKRILKPTEFSFVNEIVCQLLEASSEKTHGCQLAKDLTTRSIENVIIVAVADAIKTHQSQRESDINSVDASIARLANALLTTSQQGIRDIQSRVQNLGPTVYSSDALKRKAVSLHIEVSKRELARLGDEGRREKHLELELTALSQTLFQEIIGLESFEALLPDMFKGTHVMESISTRLMPYLKGFYDKSTTVEQVGTTLKADPEILPLLVNIQSRLKPIIALDAQPATGAEQGMTLIRLILGGISQQKECHAFAEASMDRVVESVVAYHLNPKDGCTSEERAVELFWRLSEHVEEVAALEVAADEKLDLRTRMDEALVEKYRRFASLGANEEFESIDFLCWQKARVIFEELVPAALLDSLVTKELVSTVSDQIMAAIKEQVDKYHRYRFVLRKLVAQGQSKIETSSDGGGFIGTSDIVREKIDDLLSSVKKGSIKTEDPWVDRVLVKIAGTEDVSQQRLLRELGFEVIYGLLAAAIPDKHYSEQKASLLLARFNEEIVSQTEIAFDSAESIDYAEHIVGMLESIYPGDTWKTLLPSGLGAVLTKQSVGQMLAVHLKDVHHVHRGLKVKSEEARRLMEEKPELGIDEEYVREMLVTPIFRAIEARALDSAMLSEELSPVVDRLVKEVLLSGDNNLANIAAVRDKYLPQVIETVLYHTLRQEMPAEYIVKQLEELKSVYDESSDSDDFLERAHRLLDSVIPDQVWNEVFEASGGQLISKDTILPFITSQLEEFSRCHAYGNGARNWLADHDREGGIQGLLELAFENIGRTINQKGCSDGKIMDQPHLVNDILKGGMASEKLAPVINKSIQNVVYVIVQRALAPKHPNTSIEEEFLAFCERVRLGYSDPDMGIKWLKELLPEEVRLEIVPSLLQSELTHENLLEWFFAPWIEQVKATADRCATLTEEPLSKSAQGLHRFLKAYLSGYKGVHASTKGLTGFGGLVQLMEKSLLAHVETPESPVELAQDQYLQATAVDISNRLEQNGWLDKNFLSNALISALPQFGVKGGEGSYTGKVKNFRLEDFNKAATEKVMEKLFPEGQQGLLIPTDAQESGWAKTKESVSGVFADLTERKRRIVYTLKQLDAQEPVGPQEDKKRSTEYDRLLKLSVTDEDQFLKDSKKLVSNSLWSSIRKSFTGFSVLLLPFVWVFFHLSTKHRFWDLIENKETDRKMCDFLWSMLNASQVEHATNKKALDSAFSSALADTGLIPWGFRGMMGKTGGDYMYDRNLTDLLDPEKPLKTV